MRLKKRVATLDEVPEAFRSAYTKQGEWYILDIDIEGADNGGGGGAPDPNTDRRIRELEDKLSEFRSNNVKLMQQRDAAQALADKYKDVDPDKYQEAIQALNTINAIEEKDLIKGGKFDEVIQRRLAAAKQGMEEEKKQLQKAKQIAEDNANKYRQSYSQLRVRQNFADIFSGIAAIRPGALDDVMARVERTWKLNDKDEFVADNLFNEKAEPMAPEEYARKLVKDAPHLFEPGQGGGAPGGTKKPAQPSKDKPTLRPDEKGIIRFGKGNPSLSDAAAGKAVVVGASSEE